MALFGLPLSYLVFTVLHIFAFALALAVCGLYGHDLQRANEAGVGADGRWVSWIWVPFPYTASHDAPIDIKC